MAGIEKVCEYSGEYPSHTMYDMKRNHIQICTWHRKAFRHAEHVLVIFRPEIHTTHDRKRIGGKWRYKRNEEYKYYYYEYCLYIPNIEGRVYGQYYNWSTNIAAVKRRLKRMLRLPLNIVYCESTFEQYSDLDDGCQQKVLQQAFDQVYKGDKSIKRLWRSHAKRK